MCARVIAAGDKARAAVRNGLEGIYRRSCCLDAGGILCGTDDDEVVMHHEEAVFTPAGYHKFLLGGRRVDKEHIGIPFLGHLECRAGTYSHGLNRVSSLFLEQRDKHIE